MCNAEIKQDIKEAKIPQWKIADKLGVCEMTLIRWFRKELPESKKDRIRAIIVELREGDTNG